MTEEIEIENILDLNNTTGSMPKLYGKISPLGYGKTIPEDRKIIPLFSIPLLPNSAVYFKDIVIECLTKLGVNENLINALNEEHYSRGINRILMLSINNIVTKGVIGYAHPSNIKKFFEKITKEQFITLLTYYVYKERDKLDSWVIDTDIQDKIFDNKVGYEGRINTYNNAISTFYNGKIAYVNILKTRDRNLKYVIGKYYIAHYNIDTGVTTPLVCMVTKRKYLPYFKASQMMDDYVSTDYVELWVKDDFDITNSVHRGLRSKYRREIKAPLEQAGVKIVVKDNFNELFLNYQLPKFTTINEYENFLTEASKEALQSV